MSVDSLNNTDSPSCFDIALQNKAIIFLQQDKAVFHCL